MHIILSSAVQTSCIQMCNCVLNNLGIVNLWEVFHKSAKVSFTKPTGSGPCHVVAGGNEQEVIEKSPYELVGLFPWLLYI